MPLEPWAFFMCLLPPECAAEAALAGSESTRVVRSLVEAVSVALGETDGGTAPPFADQPIKAPDLAHVRGQPLDRRALEVAAAGGHHMIDDGPSWFRKDNAGQLPSRAATPTH